METLRQEQKIHREIVRRALERSRAGQEERERVLFQKDLLNALRELTGLPQKELEQIAHEVIAGPASNGAGYFSIPYQLLFTGLLAITVLAIPVLAMWFI